MQLRVSPIVEGHGECESVRILLQRVWSLLEGEYVDVLQPIRVPRSKLLIKAELSRAIELGVLKLRGANRITPMPCMILVLLDADEDPSCRLAPQLLKWAHEAQPNLEVVCVLAEKEYESWFVASAASLTDFLDFDPASLPARSEQAGKGWIDRHFRRPRYSETLDQPKMTNQMDLNACRANSYSFDKLCRELARLICSGQS